MKRSWSSILLTGGFLILLVVSAAAQFVWLNQISDAEYERLQSKLQSDTQNFAADFNREIRSAYFTFQIDPQSWLQNDWNEFNDRYRLWQTQTDYPQLIEDFYFVGKDAPPIRYDAVGQNFKSTEWTDELREIQAKIQPSESKQIFEPSVINNLTLLMPNYSTGREASRTEIGIPMIKADLSGFVVIKLREETVNQLLADLTNRYFPDQSPHYNISISNKADAQVVYPKNLIQPIESGKSDASVAVFDLSMTNFRVIANSRIFSSYRQRDEQKNVRNKSTIIITKSSSSPPPPKMTQSDSVKFQMTDDRRFETEKTEPKGLWQLDARHADGSLKQFVGQTRRQNLAVSFGILSLLAISIVLIFVSAYRAKLFAQRQVDFVSAVSHEFRTPLAVIYSAGENLADGVAKEEKQTARYGNLIKSEGRKLSKMVEQILDFAGANSGKKKYDFRPTNVTEIIENALAECQSLLDEKSFAIEKNVVENLPEISVDKTALSQAIQNLIVNAVKYSDGEKLLKISASNGNKRIKIAVEDRGIGIAPKDLKHVFEPFYRAKSVVDEQIHGNGLGLNLVKQTVEAHGGEIEVKSEIGKGSKFTIILKS